MWTVLPPFLKKNETFHLGLKEELRGRLDHVKKGGGDKSIERHRKRNKLLPRERIEKILDEGSPFLELSPLAAFELYQEEVPSAAIVCGIGRIHGVECMLIANDATVKGELTFP